MSPTHAALEVGAVTGNPFAENIVPRFDDSDVLENDDEAEEEEALRSWKVAPQAIAGKTQMKFFLRSTSRLFVYSESKLSPFLLSAEMLSVLRTQGSEGSRIPSAFRF
jgi:hypothetical protein